MKVLKPTTHLVEIGEPWAAGRLPTGPRIQLGMKTTCAICGKAITDDHFIVALVHGNQNLKLHERCCPADVVMTAKPCQCDLCKSFTHPATTQPERQP